MIQIKYYGHSCFSVTADDYTVVLDPYKNDSIPNLGPLMISGNMVVCTHDHEDHCGVEQVKQLKSAFRNPFKIEKVESYHDDANGTKRGINNIIKLTYNDKSVVHLGDLGCVLNDEQIDKLKNPTVLLIPVGGFYTIDAKEAKEVIEQLNPTVVIPMHYRTEEYGYSLIGDIEAFKKEYPEMIISDSDEIDIDDNVKKEVIQLKYKKDESN